MSFFGAVFAAMTMRWQWHVAGAALALPVAVFAGVALMAAQVMRLPGRGIVLTRQVERAILWSSLAEGAGLFLASNLVLTLHRPDLLLPAIALVVGLHFLPIARAAASRPFHVLAAVLILSAIAGFLLPAPLGGAVAGFTAALGLWTASILAVGRDWRAKRSASRA